MYFFFFFVGAGMECFQIFLNVLRNDKHENAVTWYGETPRVRGAHSPSSHNSSSWLGPELLPKGVVGLNIAWRTALSCAEDISPASVKEAKKSGINGKLWHKKHSLGGESPQPPPLLLLAFLPANGRRGRQERWTLRFVCTEHICIWLTRKNAGRHTAELLE